MKFQITFKTPNATDAIDAALDSFHDEEERERLKYDMTILASKFIMYDEIVTIEFDTKAQTATVIPFRK